MESPRQNDRDRRAFTRRSFLVASGAGALAILGAACSSAATPPSSTAVATAIQGSGTPISAAATQVTGAATAQATAINSAATAVTGAATAQATAVNAAATQVTGAATSVANGTPVSGAVPAATPAAVSAPASTVPIRGLNLAFVGGSYFIPAAQTLFTNQIKKWGSDNGVNVSADFLNWSDLQAKIAATVQAGAGADSFELWPGWTYLYTDHLADVSDVANAMGQAQGGFYTSWVNPSVQVNGKWLGVPTGTTNVVYSYRISYFQQAGIDNPQQNFPKTWDDLFAVGKKLKQMGKPLGQALGHSTGDPPAFAYPYMWSNGAMEVQSDGKTVAFNTSQFTDAMKRFIQGWKDGFDESALAGDDAYNNRAFLADQISGTINGTSIYSTALTSSPDIAKDMDNATIPGGSTGQFYNIGSHAYGVLKGAKNEPAARSFLQWWSSTPQFGDWIHIQNTYQLPPTQSWAKDPMWTKDPKLAAVQDDVKLGRLMGYAGPPNQKAALAMSKYIVVDTFSRAVQSGDAQGAIAWGTQQLQQIYG